MSAPWLIKLSFSILPLHIFDLSIPRRISWCKAPGASSLGCLERKGGWCIVFAVRCQAVLQPTSFFFSSSFLCRQFSRNSRCHKSACDLTSPRSLHAALILNRFTFSGRYHVWGSKGGWDLLLLAMLKQKPFLTAAQALFQLKSSPCP